MKKIYVDLSGLANEDELYASITSLAYDVYPLINQPGCYEVMWQLPDSITTVIPVLPKSRIKETI